MPDKAKKETKEEKKARHKAEKEAKRIKKAKEKASKATETKEERKARREREKADKAINEAAKVQAAIDKAAADKAFAAAEAERLALEYERAKAEAQEANKAEAFFDQATAVLQLQRYGEALPLFDRALELMEAEAATLGGRVRCHTSRAECLVRLQRLPEAQAAADVVIELAPAAWGGWFYRAVCLHGAGLWQQAMACFEALLQLGQPAPPPNIATARGCMVTCLAELRSTAQRLSKAGRYHSMRGKDELAIAEYTQGLAEIASMHLGGKEIASYHEDVELELRCGLLACLLREVQWELAHEQAQRAITVMREGCPKGPCSCAVCRLIKWPATPAAAATCAARAKELAAQLAEAKLGCAQRVTHWTQKRLVLEGDELFAEGSWAEAAAVFARALSDLEEGDSEGRAFCLSQLSAAQFELDLPVEALRAATEAAALDPNDWSVWARRATALGALNCLEASVCAYERAHQLCLSQDEESAAGVAEKLQHAQSVLMLGERGFVRTRFAVGQRVLWSEPPLVLELQLGVLDLSVQLAAAGGWVAATVARVGHMEEGWSVPEDAVGSVLPADGAFALLQLRLDNSSGGGGGGGPEGRLVNMFDDSEQRILPLWSAASFLLQPIWPPCMLCDRAQAEDVRCGSCHLPLCAECRKGSWTRMACEACQAS